MDVSSINAQDASEMSEFEGVLSTLRMLFEVAGQAPVAVRAGAEGGLDGQRSGSGAKPPGFDSRVET